MPKEKKYSFRLTEHAAMRFIERYQKEFGKKIPEEFVNLLFKSLIDKVKLREISFKPRLLETGISVEKDPNAVYFSFRHYDEGVKRELVLVTLRDDQKKEFIIKTFMPLEMYKSQKNKFLLTKKKEYNRAKAKRETREEILSAVGF